MLHLKWTELLKNGVLLLEVHIIRDIPAMESFSTDIGNQFTRTENYKLRQEMTV